MRMIENHKTREGLCNVAKSLYDYGLCLGSADNITIKLSDGRHLVTPTKRFFRNLDPACLSLLGEEFNHLSMNAATKELPMHRPLAETQPKSAGVIVMNIAKSAKFSAPITKAALQQFLTASEQGLGKEDDAAVAKVYACNASLTLPSSKSE